MNKKLVAATIVAGLVMGSGMISKSFADEAAGAPAGDKASCKGKGGCKGKGECKGHKHHKKAKKDAAAAPAEGAK